MVILVVIKLFNNSIIGLKNYIDSINSNSYVNNNNNSNNNNVYISNKITTNYK